MKPIESAAEEDNSEGDTTPKTNQKTRGMGMKEAVMSSQESMDEVLMQSRMKHSDGFKLLHAPGDIRPKDPDAMHPHEYNLAITRSKD